MATCKWAKIYFKWSYFNSLHEHIFSDRSYWLSIGTGLCDKVLKICCSITSFAFFSYFHPILIHWSLVKWLGTRRCSIHPFVCKLWKYEAMTFILWSWLKKATSKKSILINTEDHFIKSSHKNFPKLKNLLKNIVNWNNFNINLDKLQ